MSDILKKIIIHEDFIQFSENHTSVKKHNELKSKQVDAKVLVIENGNKLALTLICN